jgi:hypothetical protein
MSGYRRISVISGDGPSIQLVGQELTLSGKLIEQRTGDLEFGGIEALGGREG